MEAIDKKFITREYWLRRAVEKIREHIFPSMPDLEYQISSGWTTRKTKSLGETIFPYDGEDVQLDDFFPTTIHINVKIKCPKEIIGVLAHECIHTFYGIRGHKKDFIAIAKKAGFEKKYTEYNPGPDLLDSIDTIYSELVLEIGDFPGQPVHIHKGPVKEKAKSTGTVFCGDCGFEFKAKLKDIDKFGLPTCACGRKMAIDIDDGESPTEEKQ